MAHAFEAASVSASVSSAARWQLLAPPSDEALRREAAGLAVRYNATFGYPESIQIDWVAGAVDDEVSYRITDFSLASQN